MMTRCTKGNLVCRLGLLIVLSMWGASGGSTQDFTGFLLNGRAVVETDTVNGILILPAPLDPSEYVVANRYDDAIPAADGTFQLDVRRDGVTVTAAVRQDYTEGENVWMSVMCRVGSTPPSREARGPSPELVVDATSTAQGIVLMHPFFLHPDPGRMEILEQTVAGLPQTSDLTQSVLDTYPTNSLPFDDTDFFNQYLATMTAMLDALPDSGVEDVSQAQSFAALGPPKRQPQPERVQVIRSAGPTIQVQQLDNIRELLWSSPSADKIEVKADIGMPLDSIVTLHRIDADAGHDLYEEQNDVGDFIYSSIGDITDRRNQPPQYLFFTREGDGGRQVLVAPARSLFTYVDLFGLIINAIFDAIGLGGSPGSFEINPGTDAIYELRGFNGRFVSGVDAKEFGFAWNNFRDDYLLALTLNLLNGTLDFVAVFIDLNELISACVPKLLLDTSLAVTNEFGSQVATELAPEDIAPLMGTAAKAAVTSILDCGRGQLTELVAKKPLKGLLSVGKSLLKTIDILGKASKVGALWDRVSTLTGFPGTISAVFVSPMTSAVVIVGDPFSPRITSINGIDPASPGSPLTSVINGQEITIRGMRFRRLPGDDLPRVFVTDGRGRQKEIPIEGGDFDDGSRGGSRGVDPTQTITVDIPEGLSGKLRFAILATSGRADTGQVLEVQPTLLSVRPDFAFPSVMPSVSSRLRGDGFDAENQSIILSKDGSPDVLITPVQTGAQRGTVNTLFFAVPDTTDPGNYEIKIRWRDPSEDAAADTPLLFSVLGPPVIDAISPTEVKPKQIIKIDGKNFGADNEQLTVNFRDVSSGVITGNNPIRTAITGRMDDDQIGFLWVNPDLDYIDPVPGTDEKEDMTVEATVTSPEGTSAAVTFTISEEAEPEYGRTLTFPALSLQEMIDYANQDPAPTGVITQEVVCETPIICEGSPAFAGRCITNYPASWIPEPNTIGSGDAGTNGVSPPPGRPGAPGMSCSSCDTTGPLGCPEVDDIIGWAAEPPNNIRDNLVFRPEADSPGDVVLNSVTPGTALKGPNVILDMVPMMDNPNGRIIGGGFVIEGEGIDGPRNQIEMAGQMIVEEATGTVITIRDAHDVTLAVDITGEPADIGVRIIRSRSVVLVGDIRNCMQGVVIEDSQDCEIRVEVSGCVDGVVVDGGGNHRFPGTTVGYDRDDASGTYTVPPGQMIGFILKGGTSGNRFDFMEAVGMNTGIQLLDCTDNYLNIQSVGVIQNIFGGSIDKMGSFGGDTACIVGVELGEGATDNRITGFGPFFLPALIANNEIGILIDGGDNNRIDNNRIGYNNAPGSVTTPPDGIGNDFGLMLKGDSDGNTIIGNVFAENAMFGLVVDPINGSNDIENNYFGWEPTFAGDRDLGQNGIAGLAIQGVADTQRVFRNFFKGEKIAVNVEGSSDQIFTANTFENIDEVGIAINMSSGLSFNRDYICGNEFGADGFCDSSTPKGLAGIFSTASGGLRFADVVVEGIDGNGFEFDQPPVGGGPSRLEGTADQGSFVPPPARDNLFDPLNDPPSGRTSDGRGIYSISNAGNGVVVRDGASDLNFIGFVAFNNDMNGAIIENPGNNISFEESVFVMNDANGVFIKDTDAENIIVGSPGKGNFINDNGNHGVGTENSSNISFQGNFVGGNGSVSGSGNGFNIFDSHGIQIGGQTANAPNLIGGNEVYGIEVSQIPAVIANPIRIEGNFVGVDKAGTAAVANRSGGLRVNDCGSPTFATLEIISNIFGGNSGPGVWLNDCDNSTRLVAEGNVIGRAAPPTPGARAAASESTRGAPAIVGVANTGSGVVIDAVTAARIQGNRIALNGSSGVAITDSTSTVIHDNLIDANSGDGVSIGLQSVDSSVDTNIISGHSGDGITVEQLSLRNSLTRNSISGNSDAINLTTGGNGLISPPVLTSIIETSPGDYLVRGQIPDFVPDGSRVELFASADDEAELYLAATFTLGRLFSFFNVSAPAGQTLVGKTFRATVTDLNGNTSELGELGPLPPRPTPALCLPGFIEEFDLIIASERDGEIALTNVATCDTITTWPAPELDRHPWVQQLPGQALLAFASDRDGDREIYLDDGSGSLIQLTTDDAIDAHPRIKPDGTQIAFDSQRDGNPEIYIMDIDGSNQTRITNNAALDRCATWSADGNILYFVSDRNGSFDLYSLDLTAAPGTEPVQLTMLDGDVSYAYISPDQSTFVFEYTPPAASDSQIGYLDVATGDTRLLSNGGWSDEDPTWLETPLGELFLITSSRTSPTGDYSLYLMTLDGYPLAQLTPNGVNDYHPSCCLDAFPLMQ